MDQPAEDLAASNPQRRQVGNRVGGDVAAVWWPQVPGPVRPMAVVVRPELAQLVRTRVAVDAAESFVEVGRQRVGGGDDVGSGLDLDRLVAAGCADEFPD